MTLDKLFETPNKTDVRLRNNWLRNPRPLTFHTLRIRQEWCLYKNYLRVRDARKENVVIPTTGLLLWQTWRKIFWKINQSKHICRLVWTEYLSKTEWILTAFSWFHTVFSVHVIIVTFSTIASIKFVDLRARSWVGMLEIVTFLEAVNSTSRFCVLITSTWSCLKNQNCEHNILVK